MHTASARDATRCAALLASEWASRLATQLCILSTCNTTTPARAAAASTMPMPISIPMAWYTCM